MATPDPIPAAIAACLRGDVDAFRVVVEATEHRALLFGMRMLKDGPETEDAVQAAFLRAFEKLAQYDPSRPFFPWLRAILRNDCLKRIQKRSRDSNIAQIDAPHGPTAASEGALLLEEVLQQLAPEQRELLRLKHVEGLRYREIAERLEIPIGTVMSRLHAARTKVRTLLEEEQ